MQTRKIGDFVDLQQGFAVNKKSNHLVYRENPPKDAFHLLRIQDMIADSYGEVYIDKNVGKQFVASESDIIYTRTGQPGLVFTGFVGVVHNNCFKVNITSDEIDREFFIQMISSNFVRNQILQKANSSIQTDVTHGIFKDSEIPFFDKPKQVKIGSVLSKIDSLIRLNNKKIAVLEKKIKTIYSYHFHAFHSYENLIHSKELNLDIPNSYSIVNIEQVMSFEKGFEPTSKAYIENPTKIDGLIKFYRVGDMDDSGNTYIKKEVALNQCNEEDVFVAFDASIGRISYGINGSYSSGMQKVTFKDKRISNAMAFLVMSDDRIQQLLLNGSKSNSIIKHASSLKKYISIPFNEKDYLYVDSLVKPYFDEMVQLKKMNNQLKKEKDIMFLGFINDLI